jgi:alpha-ribazole phosphatase
MRGVGVEMAEVDPVQPSCTILLVRHAHTEMTGRFCGESDPVLSEQGRRQSAKLAEELAKHRLTHLFSSDLRRTQETASYIAAKLGLAMELLPGLREMRFGEWEGLNWDEISQKDAAFAKRWMTEYPTLSPPRGEDFRAFRERVREALAEVAGRSSRGSAVVVTHGGVIRTFLLDVLNLPESALATIACDYASWAELRLQHGRWRLVDRAGQSLQNARF